VWVGKIDLIENREKFYIELLQTFGDFSTKKMASREGQTRKRASCTRYGKKMNMPDEFIYYLDLRRSC